MGGEGPAPLVMAEQAPAVVSWGLEGSRRASGSQLALLTAGSPAPREGPGLPCTVASPGLKPPSVTPARSLGPSQAAGLRRRKESPSSGRSKADHICRQTPTGRAWDRGAWKENRRDLRSLLPVGSMEARGLAEARGGSAPSAGSPALLSFKQAISWRPLKGKKIHQGHRH